MATRTEGRAEQKRFYFCLFSSCFIRPDPDSLLLLGGEKTTRRRLHYSIKDDSWTELSKLPFRVKFGACATLNNLKGNEC